jgi:lipid II:glycine glycyltransferase (peptidoglycan interpeptide bridge formation enzyme)
MLDALVDLSARKKAIFIKLEPNATKDEVGEDFEELVKNYNLRQGKNVFTPHTFQIDLTKSEDQLFGKMKPKTRYNVRLAERKGVVVKEDNSDLAFNTYLRLTRETSHRQGFYAHDDEYHRLMWKILHSAGVAHLLTATFENKILVTWIIFVFKKVIYYPYGASTNEYRDLMASNLMMWEAMKFGKRLNCKTFDLWGSLGPDPDHQDPWYGFHRFKKGYGGDLISFVGSYDLVLKPKLYPFFQVADKMRWKALRLMSKFR